MDIFMSTVRYIQRTCVSPDDIDNLPCEDLLTIDRLWVKYSGGKFGFRVQKQIYESVNEDYGKFCSQVGWLTYNLHFPDRGFKFRNWAAVGHLPSRIWAGGKKWWSHAETMAKKLDKCLLQVVAEIIFWKGLAINHKGQKTDI